MKLAKTMFAAAAALGLIVGPIAAQAAPTRTASPAARGEKLAGDATILYVALAAFAVALVIIIASRINNNNEPVSP